MSIFVQAAALISEPPGSLVYHLLLLFALGVAAALSASRWWRDREPASARVALAATALFVLRLASLVLAFLAALTLVDPLVTIPPYDRAASTLALLFIIWFLAFPRPSRPADAGLGLLAVLVLLGLGISWGLWAQQALAVGSYNNSAQETAWELVQITVLIAGLALVAWRRPSDWQLGLALLALLLVGHVIHYAFPIAGINVPGFERLVEIVAVPLLVALIYRRAQIDTARAVPAAPPAPDWGRAVTADTQPTQPILRPAAPVEPVLAIDPKAALALATLNTARDVDELSQLITVAVAHAVQAPLCLLLLPMETGNGFIVTGAYQREHERFAQYGFTVLTGASPVSESLKRGEAVVWSPDLDVAQAMALTRDLQLARSDRVLLVPIRSGQGRLFAVLGIAPEQDWPAERQGLLRSLATALAATWEAAGQRAATTADLQQARADQAAAQLELERQQEQVQILSNQLQLHRRAEAVHTEQLQELENLRGSLLQLQSELEQHRLKAEQLQAELAEQRQTALALQGEAEQRAHNVQTLQSELEQHRQLAEQWQAEAEAHRQQELQLREELERVRSELAQVAEQAAQAAAAAPAFDGANLAAMLEALSTAEARLAAEKKEVAQLRQALAESERRRAETIVAGLPARTVQAADMEVIASITQELRQPMSSIIGYADLLLSEQVGIIGALQRKFLERIKASSERIGVLLDDLMRVIDIDSGNLKLEPESVDVLRVLDDALHSCEARFQEKNLRLACEIPPNLPPIQADRDALLQIFTHLLNNSGGASASDSEIQLSVKCESDQRGAQKVDFLVVSISDTGGGIAPEDQPRVFSRLYRAEAPLIAGLGDNGMGLSIAKALVEAHGGRMWMVSNPGVGSTFYVLLPFEGKGARANGARPAP